MAEAFRGLDQIAEVVRDHVREYAGMLVGLAGENLAGLTLHGPVVTPAFDRSHHHVLNVAVLNDIDLSLLRRLAAEGSRFGKRHVAAPVIMTPTYIQDSLDTFPLELLGIQQHRVTVLGQDWFEDLEFEPEHVRLQCERELKTLHIGLRQGLLAAGGREKALGQLETDAGETLLRTLRGLLWLIGQKDVDGVEDLIAASEKAVERQLAGIRAAVNFAGRHGWEQFVTLYEDIQVLKEKADAL